MKTRKPFRAATLAERHRRGQAMAAVFLGATVFAVLSLVILLASVIDQTAGYVLVEYGTSEADVFPAEEEGSVPTLASLSSPALMTVLSDNLGPRRLKALDLERPLAERSRGDLADLVLAEVLEPEIVRTWTLFESLSSRSDILAWSAANVPDGALMFRFWLSPDFLSRSQSSDALFAGVRSAIIGSLMTIVLTVLIAFPLGLGAAIYLEEYSRDNAVNRFIKTNIYNLSGVPSIIYGMLGLGIFVRFLGPLTSGAAFGLAGGVAGGAGPGGSAAGGVVDAAASAIVDGRTVLSASLTLALLILPTIIINAQEAIRAIPRGLRESGYALGATKWQVISGHVLPASMDRILTGTVLAVSRGIGETAPLVLVGASTFLTKDPTGIFSKFTTLPIQIYQWTARPQAEFRNIAAAAIVVLMVLLMSLNATAILLRNKYRSERRG